MKKLSVPDRHMVRVAKKTLWLPGVLLELLGGMTREEARRVLAMKAGWSARRIAKYERGV